MVAPEFVRVKRSSPGPRTRSCRRRVHRRDRRCPRGAPQKRETRGAEEVEVVIFLIGLIAASSGLGLGVRERATAAEFSIDTVAKFEKMNIEAANN